MCRNAATTGNPSAHGEGNRERNFSSIFQPHQSAAGRAGVQSDHQQHLPFGLCFVSISLFGKRLKTHLKSSLGRFTLPTNPGGAQPCSPAPPQTRQCHRKGISPSSRRTNLHLDRLLRLRQTRPTQRSTQSLCAENTAHGTVTPQKQSAETLRSCLDRVLALKSSTQLTKVQLLGQHTPTLRIKQSTALNSL